MATETLEEKIKRLAYYRRRARYWYSKGDHEASISADELAEDLKEDIKHLKQEAKAAIAKATE